MKKTVSLFLAMLIMVFSFGASADYASMTDEELYAEYNLIRAEIARRETLSYGKKVLVSADGMTVTIVDEPYFEKNQDGNLDLCIDVTVVNNSENSIGIATDNCYINGWRVYSLFIPVLNPGTRKKDTIRLKNADSDADIKSLEDLESIQLFFSIFSMEDGHEYERITMNIKADIIF